MSKVANFIQGLATLAFLGGGYWSYDSWSNLRRVEDIEAHGVNTMARMTGGTKTTQRGEVVNYKVNLEWTDTAGVKRKVEDVAISGTFAREAIVEPQMSMFAPPTFVQTVSSEPIEIRYLPDRPNITPIIVKDVVSREDLRPMLQNGLVISVFGLVVLGGWFLWRRRSAAVG